MKKTFAFLWCALVGCTIVPDDSFESVPKAALKSITITSNKSNTQPDPALETETLVGEASLSENKMTLNFTGELDPFWFAEKLEKIEYTYNDRRLVSEILLTFVDGGQQVERFSYDQRGNLGTAEVKYATSGVSYDYDYTFFYLERDNIYALDSVAKVVTWTGAQNGSARGFYKKEWDRSSGWSYDYFYSIFPYQEGAVMESPEFGCGSSWSSSYDYHSSYEISSSAPYNHFKHANWVYKNGFWAPENNSTTYVATRVPMLPVQKGLSTKYDPPSTDRFGNMTAGNNACSVDLHAVSYYRLIPEMNYNYTVLQMLNTAEEREFVTAEPTRLSRYQSIDIEFQYNYAE